MGFPGAIRAIQRKPYGNATGPIHLGSVRCTGLEESLDSCQHAGIGVHNCSHGQDIGIDCKSARLVDGLSSSEGRVEVYNGNAWGTICLDDWDLLDASVICRQFGFEQAVQAAEFTVPVDGQEILMTDLECVGNETTVFECQHTEPEDVRCRHQNVAGVKCANVRLVDSSKGNEGRLEVFLDGEWGVVCSNSWGLNESEVACRQLGFPTAIKVTQGKFSGNGSSPIHLYSVKCRGVERDLESCQREVGKNDDCTYKTVDVVCAKRVHLVNAISSNEGRVEVFLNGSWRMVCGDGWDIQDATVICRELGFGEALSTIATIDRGVKREVLAAFNLRCAGDEKAVIDCRYDATSDCSLEEVAEVRCASECVLHRDSSNVVMLISDEQAAYLPGDSVEYACPDGYHLSGSSERLCRSDFTWSGVPAVCHEDFLY
ncbi:scavenger receptor cysteine-rich domain superfamily protein-like [Acanthaster planci]|uniref:Scavenger receptor cysteine-rich domain superfamily protein-like n=1 Tax=Acanthaster planci TaxID=133434 RepID=A0A8B8A116_ACAPL|nr:scavenger receptor cysteine-rich domain superfamily protein-like [Acanthaster planci]